MRKNPPATSVPGRILLPTLLATECEVVIRAAPEVAMQRAATLPMLLRLADGSSLAGVRGAVRDRDQHAGS
ncbi:hypothetical protein GCM10023161_10970 [Mycobacterium paraffinicum]|uniref:Uncharacterized protein n=1 Tax=Mycobacterium paraffinicum TaxID=53378 RepID=A0ABP8RE17_9MYCO